MRISNSMMIYDFLSSLNKSQQRMNSYQEQLSDGKIVHRPSDDPVRAIRSLRLNTDLFTNDQYAQNAGDAQAWMNQSDESISGMGSLIQRAKELVIAATSPSPSVAFSAAAKEFDGLINQAISLANSQTGDRYVFAGQQDKVVGGPFVRMTINGVEQVVYKGDDNKISMPIQAGASDPKKDSVNVTGVDLFGPLVTVVDTSVVPNQTYATSAAFSNLLRIKEQLESPTPQADYLSGAALTDIDAAHDQILLAQTQIGTRAATYTMAQNLIADNYVTISENVSANDDIDIARTTISFKNNENIYNAALAVGARIMPQSLVDFLR